MFRIESMRHVLKHFLEIGKVKIVSDNSMRGNSMSFRAIVNLHPKKDGKINMWNGSIDERLPPHSRKPYHLLVHPTIIHVFHHPECQKGFPNAPIWEASYKYIYIWCYMINYIYICGLYNPFLMGMVFYLVYHLTPLRHEHQLRRRA